MTEQNTTEEYKPLQIMNASAGSGKTYNLVMSYLKLILGDKSSPTQFSKIMAMTFTNKAAFEMKSRIIEALDFLANPIRSDDKETNKAQALTESVVAELNIEAALLKFRAGSALKQILHQYEDFHVMTIDKFNLRLIRSFALDLDLDSDFQVVLNEEQILDKVIDQLMDELDPKEMKELTSLALQYSRSKIEDQESWDFQRTLKSFALVLTNEKYIEILKDIQQIDYSANSFSFIKEKEKDLKAMVELKATQLFAEFGNYPVNDLPGKTRTAGAYEKLITDKLIDGASDGAKGFFTSAMRRNLEDGKLPESLASLSIKFDDFFIEKIGEYRILRLISKNFYNMGLLKFISERLDKIRNSEQIIRISEFNKMISDLIKDEEAPFIYERLGNRFHNFLLDEFQDTSRLQWMNIVPLIHESLSNNRYNLIVGDPKQSIYRFKNGLAEQFITLPEIYNPEQDPQTALKSAYFKTLGGKKPLKDNWRSFQNIVNFNNDFFETFKGIIPDELKSFYEDVRQNPKGKEGGYIYVDSKSVEKEEGVNHSTNSVIKWVEACVADGIEKGNICILGNTKKSCNDWAIALSGRGHKVVSSDSLMVNSDHQVKLAIAYLKWRKNPSGELEARRFSEIFYSLSSENPISAIRAYWVTEEKDGKTRQYFEQNKFILENFGSKDLFFAPFESLYNLIQGFYKMADLHEIHNPYLHHLSDMLHEFDLVFGPELELFLKDYDQKGKGSSIQTPENKYAIKIMTGHKSKGLEFPVVMIPDLNWSVTSKKSQFLLKESGHFIYQALSKSSKVERIKAEFDIEYNQSLLDRMNLAYVMFTRPVERLYVGNYLKPVKKEADFGDQLADFGKYIHEVFSTLSTQLSNVKLLESAGEKDVHFEIGEKTKPTQKSVVAIDTDFVPIELADKLWFPDISLRDQLLQDENGLTDAQRYGNQLHLLLSVLINPTDIEAQLKFNLDSGLIEHTFEDRLRADLNEVLSHKAYVELFQDAEKIWSEQAIIISATETKRPDKIILKNDETIVIDFKTGMANEKHLKQVLVYVNTLREMNYPNVRGIVFYTGDLRMVRAESV
jgi:ATP-dependent exoDNAse (exonuclease V) beta subunit